MKWTQQRVAKLTSLWHKGWTTSDIAEKMGIGKNAVIGKAHRLGLSKRPNPIRKQQSQNMADPSYAKLVVFVPLGHEEDVKKALFKAGAGQQGDYKNCCWQCLGIGQFKPGASADPVMGIAGKLETVSEWRIETLIPLSAQQKIITALRKAHPYEEPAFEIYPLLEMGIRREKEEFVIDLPSLDELDI